MKPIKNAPAFLDRRQFSLWQALYLAFFSPQIYVDVAKRWPGLCFKYFLLLLFVATLPLTARFELAVYQYYKEHLFEPLQNLPPIVVQSGQVEFEHFMPYRVVNKAHELILVIDTTGFTKRIDHHVDPELTWLLTENTLYFNPPSLKVTPHFIISLEESARQGVFEQDMSGVIVPRDLVNSIHAKLVVYGGVSLIYPCVTAMLFAVLSVIIAAFAWAAQYYVRAVFRYHIGYQATYRLLILALTPPVSICFILAAFDIIFPNGGLYYLVLFAVYFNLGVLAVRRSDRALVFA